MVIVRHRRKFSSRIAITNIADKIKLKNKRLFYPQVTEVQVYFVINRTLA